MSKLLYIPWFREWDTVSFPWNKIWKYYQKTWKSFHRFTLPWDTLSPEWEIFSLTSLEQKIFDALQSYKDSVLDIVLYSLSALPTLRALNSHLEKQNNIASCTLLHPANNPLLAVQNMDWVKRNGIWEIYWSEYFLQWNPDKVFQNLIGDWRWDGIGFQRDLKDMDSWEFERLYAELRKKDRLKLKIITSWKDMITGEVEIDINTSLYRAIVSHIPKFNPQDIF